MDRHFPDRDSADGAAEGTAPVPENWVQEALRTRPEIEIAMNFRDLGDRPVPFAYDDFD